MKAICRPYEPSDRQDVRHICNETGYLGNPIGPYFSDRELFADLHSLYYTDVESASSFVVEDDGRVIGYLLGCLDSDRYRAWVKKELEPSIIGQAFRRGVLWRPGTAPLAWRFLFDWIRERRRIADTDHCHPAHLHINLLPEGRGRGYGKKLMQSYFKLLQTHGIGGVFLETTSENVKAVEFFSSLGFVRDVELPAPGLRAIDGSRLHTLRMSREIPLTEVMNDS